MHDFVPLSIREGSRRKRVRWGWLCVREWIALRIAPWLDVRTPYAPDARIRKKTQAL